MTQLESNRKWLLTIHCVNHRLELAVKSAMNDKYFKKAEKFYITNYYLLRNSGKLKSSLKEACQALGITYYVFPKIHGTRFVHQRKNGYTRLLHMWPALCTVYEDAQITTTNAKTRSKILGLLKKLRDTQEIFRVGATLHCVDLVAVTSLIFEREYLLPHEISASIKITINKIDDVIKKKASEMEYLNYFRISSAENGKCEIARRYPKPGHEKKKIENREFSNINVQGFTYRKKGLKGAASKVSKTAENLKEILSTRFDTFDLPIYKNMRFFDPKYWKAGEKSYGEDQIKYLYNHFQVPLDKHNFDLTKSLKEWQSFKILVEEAYSDFLALELWKVIITKRANEFPNLVLLAKLLMCISGSNSTVERAFSVLTQITTSLRVNLKHDVMEDIMIISCNNQAWSKSEKEEILEKAYAIYRSKR